MNIEEVRQKYPQYSDLSDDQLLRGIHQKYYSDMPAEQFMSNFQTAENYGEPVVENGQYKIGGPIDVGKEFIAPIVEPAAALATGMIADPIANIAGGIEAYNPLSSNQSPLKGPEMRDRIREMMTYKPRTPGGQRVVQGYGEVMAPVGEFIEKGRLHEEAADAGLPEWAQKNAAGIPEYILATITGMGLTPKAKGAGEAITKTKTTPIGQTDKYGNLVPGMDKKAILRDQLRRNTKQGATAKWELQGQDLVKSPTGKDALSQGWDEVSVAGVKSGNAATKAKIKRMVDVAKARLPKNATAETRIDMRPSDIAGKSLMDRYTFIENANKSSGRLLGKIAQDLGSKGVRVDINGALKWLGDKFDEIGVKFNRGPNGEVKIDFGNLDLANSDKAMLRENIAQIARYEKKAQNGALSFADAHRLKQIMRRTGVSYKDTFAKTGASPEAQSIFKGFSSKIDEVMDQLSPAYDKQNVKFGETMEALESVRNIAKDTLKDEAAFSNLGTLTKRMMGNPVSRNAVIGYTKKLDEIAKKYGAPFEDDLFTQAYIANDMDKVIEVAASTSLKGEAGAQAFANQIDRSTIGKAAHAVDTAARFIGRRSEEKALDTLQALTK